MKTVSLLLLLAFAAPAAFAAGPTKDPYHVMWTNDKGEPKCMNKGTKEKADRCAERMRSKGKGNNVQVMAGKCADM